MLARIEPPHGDFPALASYLRHGRTRPTSPDRVAWVIGHNIPTADPMLAAAIMTATARQSARCTTPAYHLSINWREDERPAPEAMQEIARRTLELAGLGEHQALVMGHGDKPHRHLHMMINRVHPGTGKAWSAFQDFRRFDRIMKALAEAHGFLFVPCHRYEPEITDARPKLPGREARRAAEKGADTLRIQGSRADARRIGAEISENLDRAASWDDIEAALEPYGLQLEAKGRGLVAGNRAGYFKFSQLGLAVTANGLAKRFGRRFRPRPAPVRRPARSGPRRPHPFTVDAVDVARAIGSRADIRNAVREAAGKRKARLARAPLLAQLLAELKEQWKTRTSLSAPGGRKARPAGKSRRPAKTGRGER